MSTCVLGQDIDGNGQDANQPQYRATPRHQCQEHVQQFSPLWIFRHLADHKGTTIAAAVIHVSFRRHGHHGNSQNDDHDDAPWVSMPWHAGATP
jgi:hypothetical protein